MPRFRTPMTAQPGYRATHKVGTLGVGTSRLREGGPQVGILLIIDGLEFSIEDKATTDMLIAELTRQRKKWEEQNR